MGRKKASETTKEEAAEGDTWHHGLTCRSMALSVRRPPPEWATGSGRGEYRKQQIHLVLLYRKQQIHVVLLCVRLDCLS
jgi:hypothetical protein